jgi:predicted metal-dependent hydrolase
MPKPHRRSERLKERVALWAIRLKMKPRLVRVQRMTRKWGSRSTAGTITLAADLSDQEIGFQDFVIAHELLHSGFQTTAACSKR